jgi:hypothetical protein
MGQMYFYAIVVSLSDTGLQVFQGTNSKENRGEEVRLIVPDLDGSENVDITRAWTVNKLPISKRSIPTTNDVFG